MAATSFRSALVEVLLGARSPVIRDATRSWSGRELLAAAWGAADWLDGLGAPWGHPVAGLLYGSGQSFALAIGGALTNRPLAPLNPKLTAAELGPVISNLSPSVLVVDPKHEHTAAEAGIDISPTPLLDGFPEGPPRAVPDDADAPIAVLHTSGTTGAPKPVPISDGAMLAKARVTADAYELSPGDQLCTVPPFHHMSGLIMGWSALVSGAAIAPVPWFSMDAWAHAAADHPSHVLVVPTMLEMLLRADSLPEDVRVVAYGGSPIHPALLTAVMERIPGVRFVQVFGQTEGSPLSKLSHEDHLEGLARPQLLGSAGRPVPSVRMRIDDADQLGVGEIVVQGDYLFGAGSGEDLRTGDFGRVDERGYLFLVGRKGDKIIRGGENVYPLEVERALESHPGIREAGVIGVPDERLGEAILAVIVPLDVADPPSVDELRAYVRQRLSGFKVPAHWRFQDSLPRNASGKLLRRVLMDDGS